MVTALLIPISVIYVFSKAEEEGMTFECCNVELSCSLVRIDRSLLLLSAFL